MYWQLVLVFVIVVPNGLLLMVCPIWPALEEVNPAGPHGHERSAVARAEQRGADESEPGAESKKQSFVLSM